MREGLLEDEPDFPEVRDVDVSSADDVAGDVITNGSDWFPHPVLSGQESNVRYNARAQLQQQLCTCATQISG